ncbi:unnamed protein product [Adineta ricciae]|uniref:Uncharacterized protein n=1 Tax=Adineta ricciae TaxID=249248 RepID=A0A814JKM2_ADIRI|nr:unnamed protein product [Adineta ricciae]
MEDELLEKTRQVERLFQENLLCATNGKEHVNHLHQELERWHSDIRTSLQTVLQEKHHEIEEYFEQYQNEIKDKHERFKQIHLNSTLTDINAQLEQLNIYCQSNFIDNRLKLTVESVPRSQLADKAQIEYLPYTNITHRSPIEPLKVSIPIGKQSKPTSRTSTVTSTVLSEPGSDGRRHDSEKKEETVQPATDPEGQDRIVSKLPSRTTTVTGEDHAPKSSTQLYVGRKSVFTPVLINKNRQCADETKEIVEYSIDSIQIFHTEQLNQSSSSSNENDNDSVVRAYKVVINNEDQNRRHSTLSSSSEQVDGNLFDLQHFNRIDYSTIMFRKCETQYNCLATSTKQNELVVYNSKLKVLIVLQHERHQACRHRFYLEWPTEFSPQISDITYCHDKDEYLISTLDTAHIYSFNRNHLSITDLGRLSDDLLLRRIHCHYRTVYCILSDNYLLEYQFDESCSNLKFAGKKIMLYNPHNRSQDTAYHLLDVACNDQYLVIVYADDQDGIHLQSIHRRTKEFHSDIVLDQPRPINQTYIRIEPVIHQQNFIYLEGEQQLLRTVDFTDDRNGQVTSVVRRVTKPTNVCFLADGRFVILYERPYFLSVHGTHQ